MLLDGEATVIGALADSVEEVIDLEPEQIQPPPRIGPTIRTDFIKGMGKRDAQFIMILDIDRVFSAEELSAVRERGRDRNAGRRVPDGRGGESLLVPRRLLRHVEDDLLMTTYADTLSIRDLNRLCRLIYQQSGITLGAEKKIMLEGRLKRRITTLHLSSYKEYCDYLFEGNGHDVEEMVHLIDAVSTNKTDFFREKTHFDFLVARALPELTARGRTPGK